MSFLAWTSVTITAPHTRRAGMGRFLTAHPSWGVMNDAVGNYDCRWALAPMLFSEEAAGARQSTRKSIVAPTQATPVALAKRGKKLTEDGFPVQDFRGLLKTLATQTQQVVQPAVPKLPTFRRVTPANPYQKRAFDLLQLSAL